MRCPKCDGLVIDEYDVERGDVKRCINCGLDPDRKILAEKCKYENCFRIPIHGTICTEHHAIAERKRHAMKKALEKARAVRWPKEAT